MSNNLKQAKKDLKAFAKRAKNVKYTESLLFSYLITGMVTFSIGINTSSDVLYERMNKELVMSADKTRTAIKKKKKANEEAVEELNLELVQLMEQGDQVVKSPWSSWQFGANTFISSSNGTYKGRGDKAEKYEFNKSIPTFISVGTVFPQKGFDRLLEAHKRLLDKGLFHKLLIIGDGYDFENIKKLKSDLGLDKTATMLGFTSNPYPYFSQADFYILSSRYEGFPTVLFEAITLKKNIIATDVSGVAEMLENGRLGLIVENSQDGIYKGMEQALLHPESFKTYENNLRDYQMPFDLKNSVGSIMNIIDNI